MSKKQKKNKKVKEEKIEEEKLEEELEETIEHSPFDDFAEFITSSSEPVNPGLTPAEIPEAPPLDELETKKTEEEKPGADYQVATGYDNSVLDYETREQEPEENITRAMRRRGTLLHVPETATIQERQRGIEISPPPEMQQAQMQDEYEVVGVERRDEELRHPLEQKPEGKYTPLRKRR